MDRFQEELDLEERFRKNQITEREEFLAQLSQVYDLVNGDVGRKIFKDVVLPGLLRKHGSDIGAAGLEALALLAEASFKPHTDVDSFLNARTAEKIPGKGANSSIDGLVATTTGSLQQGVMPEAHIFVADYSQLPVIVYTDDSSLNRKPWSNPVYQSAHVTMSHKLTFKRKVMRQVPKAEFVLGAETAEVTKYTFDPVGYEGKVDGKIFSFSEGSGPLIISHGTLGGVGYKHSSDSEYAFLYITTPHGKKHSKRMLLFGEYKNVSVSGPSATLAIFAVLPKQLYENLVEDQFRGIDDFVMNALPQWQNYLKKGTFFSKPRVIGRIEGINQ